mmetsp:Transcript_27166/g.78272  ORF Transcript_27166/g.78272 Transcript_27166/m.78272 type:complete len:288 (-) Transcript_27166:141-1004(-)|eukprot:CAMPEP_0168456224 /NCGR_PEP_ID=MMETSP0228-20121227/51177_1 /TAXON_ID=133427 /ORGANISM="Protoceratium reticulatum, Strain CCCM 535 (=CCMP 1889)" /LENGTH=287 /DNA_ID=CAMNT_0008471137 /DNA_START=81 /DNA_END=944 /DNA_ORIENTATION=+
MVEKHEWRQKVCLDIQSIILPNYGFQGSRKGVWASGEACRIMRHTDPQVGWEVHGNYLTMNWLTNPDCVESDLPPNQYLQNYFCRPSPGEGEGAASGGYRIRLAQPEHDNAIFDIAHCQGALAGAHQAMYKEEYPNLELTQWFGPLGCKSVRDALDRGVLVFYAEAVETGRVAGYISCTCVFEGADKEDAGAHANISNIVVLKHHRGHGVGKMLYDGLMEHLSEACPSVIGDMRISVAEKNVFARGWYERLGFAAMDRWTVYPSNCRVDFIKMQRSMDGSDFDDLFC